MDLAEFLRYTIKADELIIKALAATDFSIAEANTLFSHILSAQHIWAKRIRQEQPNYAVWEVFQPVDFEIVYQANMSLLQDILATKVLTDEIAYQNATGSFKNSIAEILMHVCNHGTYHRAQLAKMLKQAGYIPPVTDYIILKRQGLIDNSE